MASVRSYKSNLRWKHTSVIHQIIGSLCAYLMSSDAGFKKHLQISANTPRVPKLNESEKLFFTLLCTQLMDRKPYHSKICLKMNINLPIYLTFPPLNSAHYRLSAICHMLLSWRPTYFTVGLVVGEDEQIASVDRVTLRLPVGSDTHVG